MDIKLLVRLLLEIVLLFFMRCLEPVGLAVISCSLCVAGCSRVSCVTASVSVCCLVLIIVMTTKNSCWLKTKKFHKAMGLF